MLVTQNLVYILKNTYKHLEYYVQSILHVTNHRHCGQPELYKFHACDVDRDVDCYLFLDLHWDRARAVCICVRFHAIDEDGDDLKVDRP